MARCPQSRRARTGSAPEPGSPADLATLDTYCAGGSLHRAVDLLHLHHSSVARRLDQIGKAWASSSPTPRA
ncbi:hypothetical protein HEK616_34900 [Streptomyces nigrescens]|nr:hypothetical protein HEK616_34900 [Streptomyces nigrescens]